MYKWKLGLLWAFLLVAHIVRADDIIITNESELRALAGDNSYEGQTIYLANDISLTSVWTPIGTAGNPFMGHFEGWGHKISGLSITGSSNYQGLFGYIKGGSVRDVAVVGTSSITGDQYVGAICGYLDGGEISSCYSEANVTGTTYVGGICGSSSGIVKDCYVTGSVTSSATGDVYVGGIVGYLYGTLQYCYMSGTMSISGSAYYGGIVGYIHGQSTLSNCIYDSALDTSSIYAVGSESGSLYDSRVNGKSAEDMKKKATWTGILNTETYNIAWKIEDESYPQLYSFLKNEPITLDFTSTKRWLSIVPNGDYTVPSGVRAYIVSRVDKNGDVRLRSVKTLNEGRGALLYCQTDINKSFTAYATSGPLADYSIDRWLKGSHVSPVPSIGGTQTHDYILYNGETGSEFRRAKQNALARGKAYLHLSEDEVPGMTASSRLTISFEDETTVVDKVDAVDAEDALYDLSGRRISMLQLHGVIIQNGKKLLKR